MKFIVNAHLPRSLVRQLNAGGHDAIHTRDLANGNRSTDAEICEVSLRQERILITKDSDFVDTFLVKRGPFKLLLLTTGNITNNDLSELFLQHLEQIETAFEEYSYIELGRTQLVLHQ